MDALRHPVTLHTRAVLLWYAAAVGALGLASILWGPTAFGVGPAGTDWSDPGLIRLFGAIGLGAAFAAVALARAEDLDSRRGGVLWFVFAHVAVLLAVVATEGESHGLIAGALVAAIVVLGYTWQVGDGLPDPLVDPPTTLFGSAGATAARRLRSAYERQIRAGAAQEERARLARDLHDSIKQQIFVMQTAAATVEARFDRDAVGAKAALADIRRAAREAAVEMDAMLEGLRSAPLENAGLVEALRQQCDALRFRTGAGVTLTVGSLPASRALPPGAHDAMFRIAQEALSNVARHARAGHVEVTLGIDGQNLALTVDDDGVGFEPLQASPGLGISNMRARAEEVEGTLSVTKRGSVGARVALHVPVWTFADADVREYRMRVVGYGLLLMALVLFGYLRGEWVTPGSLSVLIGILLVRDLVAYRRAAKAVRGGR